MMSPLPQELIDTIVDRVADASDTASLRACLHVSRSFRSRSRMHLFRDVRIDSAAQCARLHALFAMDPTAATLVHKLDVVDPIPRDPRRFKEETWIGRDDLLPGVVQQLAPHLHALDLSSEGYHYGNRDYTHVLRWNKASEALKRALVAVFRGPNIRFVSLAGVLIDSCQMLFSLFDGSPVERLDLPSFWHDAECRVDPDISTLHPPRLQSLSIILSTCLVNYLLNPLCAVHLDRLSRISITVPGNCSLEIRSAATAILSDSVEHLILNENIYFGEIPDVFTLTECHNLKVIHLVTRVYTMDNSYWTYITRMMETISTPNSLKEIRMELDLVTTVNPNDVSEWLDWTSLEAVLAMPTMAALERVNVMLNITGHQVSNSLEVWIGKGLPVLKQKGVTVGMRHRYI
ncbi:hypothetical protein CPB85DRAFT_1252991 [Mucidula mucida]|nr:hypothetical protein CPB85DRAFT_1252991 [Mucidula mucida]